MILGDLPSLLRHSSHFLGEVEAVLRSQPGHRVLLVVTGGAGLVLGGQLFMVLGLRFELRRNCTRYFINDRAVSTSSRSLMKSCPSRRTRSDPTPKR